MESMGLPGPPWLVGSCCLAPLSPLLSLPEASHHVCPLPRGLDPANQFTDCSCPGFFSSFLYVRGDVEDS